MGGVLEPARPAVGDRPPGGDGKAKGECLGPPGPRRLAGACASISSVPAARGTVWGSEGGGAGSGGG